MPDGLNAVGASFSFAQKVTGTLGSPSATTTITGKQAKPVALRSS